MTVTDESKAVPMLQDASTSEDVRSLLAFARAQGPGQGDLDRLSKRMSPLVGVSVAELSVPMGDLGTPPANPPGFGPGIAAGKGAALKVGLSGLSKALVAASIVSAGVVWWAMPAPEVRKPQPASAKIAAPAVHEAPRVAPAASEIERVEPPPTVEPLTPPVRKLRARSSEPKAAAIALENPSEMELIREAEYLRKQPSQALRKLDEHARLYPDGMLAQEREVLAIEALLAAGQRPAAEARAERLAANHPGSAHLRRVRVLLGSGSSE